ncbi:hypothetical protein BpHYR1_036889 [Brachionus plicatilis]|uniref:Uncharacterized protein n=1 Tax=Brachionus plicatilis TaxID=10195 RepID=A0A3M7QT56_BRAPC|nr:hypothetical protein BpHYR1_036889 [Brachionus plicatilis]
MDYLLSCSLKEKYYLSTISNKKEFFQFCIKKLKNLNTNCKPKKIHPFVSRLLFWVYVKSRLAQKFNNLMFNIFRNWVNKPFFLTSLMLHFETFENFEAN